MEYTLQLIFICENGDKSAMSISDVKSNLAKDDVTALMDAIITNNIFTTKNGALVSKYSAQVTERQVTKWELV